MCCEAPLRLCVYFATECVFINQKGSPLLHFSALCDIFRKKIFFRKFQVFFQKIFLRFLSLRYTADLRRSRLVKIFVSILSGQRRAQNSGLAVVDGHVQWTDLVLHQTEGEEDVEPPDGRERDHGLCLLLSLSLLRHLPDDQRDELQSPRQKMRGDSSVVSHQPLGSLPLLELPNQPYCHKCIRISFTMPPYSKTGGQSETLLNTCMKSIYQRC